MNSYIYSRPQFYHRDEQILYGHLNNFDKRLEATLIAAAGIPTAFGNRTLFEDMG